MIIDFIIEDLLLDSYLQKNFHTPGNTVSIRPKDNRPMSQIDIGIVKYHFEVGAGRENFIWK